MVSYPFYREFRDRNQVFDGLLTASWGRKVAMRAGSAESEVVIGRMISGNFFGTLGVGAVAGRTIQESDDRVRGGSPVVALSYGLWTRRFARSPSVLGSRLNINGYPFQVVGVLQPGFHGIEPGTETDLYMPIHMTAQVFSSVGDGWQDAGWYWLWAMGRLKPGVTAKQAQAALNTLAPHVAEAVGLPSQVKLPPLEVLPGARGSLLSTSRLERPVLLLMCATGFVLLIACANVANLWMAGAAARGREMAIRTAVGAGRWRLMRQLLTESALVAALGGIAGVLLAFWVSDALTAAIGGFLGSFRASSPLNVRVLAFAASVSVISGAIFGLWPAWRASRSSVAEAMRPAGISAAGGGRFGGRVLVAAQVALSAILLVGAGLFARTLGNLREIDTGFQRDRVLLVDVQPGEMGYSGQRLRIFYDTLLERARSHPGVAAASLSLLTPLSGAFRTSTMTGEGFQHRPGGRRDYYVNPVSAGYFATIGIPMLMGRDFRPEDEPVVAGAGEFIGPGRRVRDLPRPEIAARPRRVVIINESLARHFFGTANAIGRRISFGDQFWAKSALEVVGVVKDIRHQSVTQTANYILYTPNWIEGAEQRTLAVRTTGDPKQLVAAIRADVRALDAGVPVQETLTLDDQFNKMIGTQRLLAHLSTAFGLLAAVLAAIGLYGVLAQGVARRTREIGIRMALGADRRSVVGMIVRESGAVVLGGMAAGIAGAAMLTRLIAGLLYGVKPLDPLAFSAAAVLLLAVCLTAAWVPARRAASVDPLEALRNE